MTDTEAWFIIFAIIIVAPIIIISSTWLTAMMVFDVKQKEEQNTEEDNYTKPQFKELTEEQIADIHSRGKITPEEVVEEWENMGLCAPGDAIGSAAWRCKKFKYHCHDCLVDYANENDEYTSFFKEVKLTNGMELKKLEDS